MVLLVYKCSADRISKRAAFYLFADANSAPFSHTFVKDMFRLHVLMGF